MVISWFVKFLSKIYAKIINNCFYNEFLLIHEEIKARFFLWIPVLLGVGIGFYFGMTSEPPITITLTTLFISALSTYYLRHYYKVFVSSLLITIILIGFLAAQIRTSILDTSVLPHPVVSTSIQGRIAEILPGYNATKIVLENIQAARINANHVPTRLRLHLKRTNLNLSEGQWIRTRASLKPVPTPTHPKGYDLQRHMYFKQIGAIGFATGGIIVLEDTPTAQSGYFSQARLHIQNSIQKALSTPAEQGMAIALLTGNRGFLSEDTKEAVRAAGLAHLLAISGLHIGLVCTITFVTLRFILALIPGLALRYPIKKWAAGLAILSTLYFTLLTGASIPTQRAFVMTSIFLIGIMLDRRAISLRSVAWAAIIILLIFPESLVGASFQLSFAAVTALVAAYEVLSTRAPDENRIVRYMKGVIATSAIASLATTPFAAALFNRVAVYALGANLLAVPLTVFWIMPAGMVALLTMPFGGEGLALLLMGWGISLLLWVSDFFAQLPHAHLVVPHIPTATVVCFTFGALILLLSRFQTRLLPTALGVVSLFLIIQTPQPDMLISDSSQIEALRSDEGDVLVSNLRRASYVREKWLSRWGEADDTAKTMTAAIPCDQNGCLYRHKEGINIVINRHNMALAEDCRRADLLITPNSDPINCLSPQYRITAYDLNHNGAHAVYITPDHIQIDTVRKQRGQRPWTVYRQ